MANAVFANGREIACKAGAGKTICAMPDVCFTPPENPATPPGVPIPYPNTGMASDTTDGSKKVKISKKEVGLKNKSSFKKSMGDEAGAAAKKGVITSKNTGKVFFESWSMDVKIEGKNAVRHLDMTTNNHASTPGDTPPWVYVDNGAVPPAGHPCENQILEAQEACADSQDIEFDKISEKGNKTKGYLKICDSEGKCEKAMSCILVPKKLDKKMCCAPNNTGHHLIEDHWIKTEQIENGEIFRDAKGKAVKVLVEGLKHLAEKVGGKFKKTYGPYDGAPTMCVNKSRYDDLHGIAHGTGGILEKALIGKEFKYKQAKAIALVVHDHAYPDSDCPTDCLTSQLDGFYGEEDVNLSSPKEGQAPMTKDGEQEADAFARFRADPSTEIKWE